MYDIRKVYRILSILLIMIILIIVLTAYCELNNELLFAVEWIVYTICSSYLAKIELFDL